MKPFEESFQRLEDILQIMNEPKTTLDGSLKLFAEADTLIKNCSEQLKNAEEKVQILLKNRDGSVQTNESNEPELVEFNH